MIPTPVIICQFNEKEEKVDLFLANQKANEKFKINDSD